MLVFCEKQRLLGWAARWSTGEVYQLLLDCGCTPGPTALSIAARCGRIDSCRVLLEHASKNGAPFDLNAMDRSQQNYDTPLHGAAENHQAETCRLLLEYGADPNLKDWAKCTALFRACEVCVESTENDVIETLKLLIPLTKIEEDSYRSPLHYAAASHGREVLQILIEAGFSVDFVDDNGETPLDWAKRCGNQLAIEFLEPRSK